MSAPGWSRAPVCRSVPTPPAAFGYRRAGVPPGARTVLQTVGGRVRALVGAESVASAQGRRAGVVVRASRMVTPDCHALVVMPCSTSVAGSALGELRVGDRVFDESGRPCTIIGVVDQPSEVAYRLYFSD